MAAKRIRLDAELVRRKICESRERGRDLIASGRVIVNGVAATKPATQGEPTTAIALSATDEPAWASRGARKLLGALDAFPEVSVDGARCLDAGASTGGFTDVLLARGASRVEAVDVGYGQLVWRIRNDDRVGAHDKTNVRTLAPGDIGGAVDLVVSDLSFISLRLVLPALASCVRPGGDLLPMVKPQFEVGSDRVDLAASDLAVISLWLVVKAKRSCVRPAGDLSPLIQPRFHVGHERAGHGGGVSSPDHRSEAVTGVAEAAAEQGLANLGCLASPI